jgi:putative hydroxymethylpyrimidine transport system permease protein
MGAGGRACCGGCACGGAARARLGLRVARPVAPIGAVVGEWVGASAGLGYMMLHANGRSQTDVMFAALLVLALMALALWFTVDRLLRRAIPWQPDSLFSPEVTR